MNLPESLAFLPAELAVTAEAVMRQRLREVCRDDSVAPVFTDEVLRRATDYLKFRIDSGLS